MQEYPDVKMWKWWRSPRHPGRTIFEQTHRMSTGLSHALLPGLVLVSASLSAQWDLHFQAGAGTGRCVTDLGPLSSRGEYQVLEHRPSWTAGLRAGHTITGRLLFTTGLHWTSIGGYDELWVRDRLANSMEHRYHLLTLPLMVQLRLGRFRVGGGYRFGVPLGGKQTYTQYSSVFSPGSTDLVSTTNNPLLEWADMGLLAEASYHGPGRMEFGLRYYRGLVDIRDHSDGFMAPVYPEQVVLLVGYRLLPGKAEREAPTEEPAENGSVD